MKNFVIDTNVLLQDPESIFSFEENTVIIPIGVIEELDTFKKDHGELGRNSRQVSRTLDKFRENGDLREGVCLDNGSGGVIKVIYNGNLGTYKRESNVDYHVLHVAEEMKKLEKDNESIVISRDINVRLKANALGLKAEGYDAGQVCESAVMDVGYLTVEVNRKVYGELAINNECDIDLIFDEDDIPWSNYYLTVQSPDESKKIIAKVSMDRTRILRVFSCPDKVKIKPKNKEQAFAMDALLDPDVHLICLVGMAGTGKSILATAAGEYLVEKDDYEKLLISRPVQPMGKDIGYLPGDINEKLDPWMQPIYDALEVIHSNRSKKTDKKGVEKKGQKKLSGKKIVELSDKIFIEPLTYIRGRSIHHQYVIVDESQNLTPLEIKTIITRAGENTKIILTGDIDQIDNPYLDSRTNGLSVVLDAFKDSKYSAHIVMKEGVRSILSEEAAKRL